MDNKTITANDLPLPLSTQQTAPDNAGAQDSRPIDQLFTALQNKEDIRLILEQNDIDLSVQNENGHTPLHASIYSGDVDAFNAIMKCKQVPYVDARNKQGETTFIAALVSYSLSKQQKVHVMNALVEANADINLPMLLPSLAQIDNPEGFLQGATERSALTIAVIKHNTDAAKLLIKSGADTNSHDVSFESPIHAAINSHQSEMVDLLIAANVRLDTSISAHMNLTALEFAISRAKYDKNPEYLEIIKSIVSTGAEIDKSILSQAAKHDHILDALLKGNIDTPDVDGVTPRKAIFDAVSNQKAHQQHTENKELHIAAEKFNQGNFNLTKLFLEAIGNPELQKEFISSRMKMAVEHNDHFAMDAMRDLDLIREEEEMRELGEILEVSTIFYSPKEEGSAKQNINKSKETAAEKIVVTNFLTSDFIEAIDHEDEFTVAHPQYQHHLSNFYDKIFFTALTSSLDSYTYTETVVLSKIALEFYANELQDDGFLINAEEFSMKASGTHDSAAPMDRATLISCIHPCVIAQTPEVLDL